MKILFSISDRPTGRISFTQILLFTLGIGLFSIIAACGGGGGGNENGPGPTPNPIIAAIEVSPASVTIAKNSSQQFSAVARDSSGNALSGVTFTWSSDTPTIVSIDANGLASGLAEGSATITATSGGLSKTATIQVTFRLFLSPTSYPVGPSPASISSGDFNDDGIVDLVSTNTDDNTISLLKGTGGGLFSVTQSYSVGIFPQSLTTGRFDPGTFDDLAVANFGDPSHDSSISMFLGIDSGIGSTTEVSLSTNGPIAIVTADFNNDGKQDLATLNLSTVDLSLIFGNGDGTFQSPLPVPFSGNGPIALLAVDLNNDTWMDLVVVFGSDNQIAILLNDGSGGFPSQQFFSTTGTNGVAGPNAIVSGDWNGDGNLDLAVVNSDSSQLILFFGDGIGGLSAQPVIIALGGRPEFAATGDFNHDGKPDIAVSNSANKTVSILLNLGGGLFSDPIQHPTGNRPLGVVARDLNGDGRDDLAVTNAGDNTISVFLQTNPD
ncbi:MAG: VCBS repeat-containing protein [Nitrospirae bacterium]|nr:VCBS repeat-containing protein [Candidatus Manganitrophaceae bacterium]